MNRTHIPAGLRMVSSTLINSRRQPYPVLSCKSRLLIVSDSAELLARLRASLAVGDVEIMGVSFPEEMCSACCGGYDLVVVNVSSELISGVLEVHRGCEGCAKIPVLVEAVRLTADSRLAGLLPQCRAMPCSQPDMVALARRQIAPNKEDMDQKLLSRLSDVMALRRQLDALVEEIEDPIEQFKVTCAHTDLRRLKESATHLQKLVAELNSHL
jgi:hypothetical protein